MTTRSVHQYVLGIYRKLGLKEENCTKMQTGGPDGDLGSNEIKISKDKTIGIVDGSGVLVFLILSSMILKVLIVQSCFDWLQND